MSPRPWCKPYWTTIAIVAGMICVLAWANFRFGDRRWVLEKTSGWPAIACTAKEKPYLLSFSLSGTQPTPLPKPSYRYDYNLAGLLIDSGAFVLILAAVTYVAESWRRRPVRPWQFNLRFVLIAVTVACLLYGLHDHFDVFYSRWTSKQGWLWFLPRYQSYDWIANFPWYVVIPLLFGECCLVYAAAWLSYQAITASVRRIRGVRQSISQPC